MGHGYKIVLPADAADLASVVETIGAGRSQQGHHNGGINEACFDALQSRDLLTAVELVHVGDIGHADFFGFLHRHGFQLFVHGLWSQEKARMQHHAALELAAEAVLVDLFRGCLIPQVRVDRACARAMQSAIFQGNRVFEETKFLQKLQVLRGKPGVYPPFLHQGL